MQQQKTLLHLGIMKGQELSDWFGISLKTYQNGRRKRLEELKDYADFEVIRGGVKITHIWLEEYQSKNFQEDELYDIEVKIADFNICSVAGMVRKLEQENRLPKGVSPQAMRRRLLRARNRLYGDPKDKESNPIEKKAWSTGGTKGKDRYVWAVKVDDFNTYRFMTKAEENKFYEIIKKYYTPEVIADSGLRVTPEDGQSEEDLNKELQGDTGIKPKINFLTILQELKEELGIQLVKATEHKVLTSMERAKEERKKKPAW